MLKNLAKVPKIHLRLPQPNPKVETLLLGTTAVLCLFTGALSPYRTQYLSARILEFTFYTVGLVASVGYRAKVETPQKRQKREQAWMRNLEKREEALTHREEEILGRELKLEQAKVQANQALQQRETEFLQQYSQRLEEVQAQYEAQISQLKAEIGALNAPQLDPGALNQNNNCNRLIQYLWRQHDITLDYRETIYDPVTRTEKYIVQLRHPRDIRKLRDEKLLMELEALMNSQTEGLISVSQLGANIVISYQIGVDSRETQTKKHEALQSQMFKIEQTVGLSLGYFLAGNSGSGKTAIASYLAHVLVTKKPTRQEQRILLNQFGAEGIVLDIHNNAVWREVGLTVIYEPLAILDYILAIRQEYKQRKGGKKGNRLVIFVDELEELLTEIEASFDTVSEAKKASKAITDTVRMLGSGGRKFALNIIVMNQSWNTTAIKLDSNHRNNFVGIALNAACDNYVQQKCGAKTFDKLRDWVFGERKDKYRAITFGAVSPRAIRHPTHHDYQKVADGQPPQNLKTIEWLPLSLSPKELDIEPVPLIKVENRNEQRPGENQSTLIPVQSFPQTSQSLEYARELDCSNISPKWTVVINQSEKSSSLSSVHQSTDVICPYCQQTNLIKNGKKRGKQRWRCQDCTKFFTEN